MNVNLKYCTIAAIIAVVLFSVTIGYVMNSGQASYTQASETWSWTVVQNTTYAVRSGAWVMAVDASTEEGRVLTIGTEGTILVPIFAVNPNPTLYIKTTKETISGHLLIYRDGIVGSAQMANISLYSPAPAVYNNILIIPTNLTAGYSTLNLTVDANGTQSYMYLSAMWLR